MLKAKRKAPPDVFHYRYWRDEKHGWKAAKTGTVLPDMTLQIETIAGETKIVADWQELVKVPTVHHGAFTTKRWRWVRGFFKGQPLTGDPRER